VLFVGGVHGVGKTSLCGVAAQRLRIRHYTASQIIRDAKASAIAEAGKLVANVDANQELLVGGLRAKSQSGVPILLDGHFTLQTARGIESISVDVFRRLELCGAVVITDDPANIKRRLVGRDGGSISLESIELHQDKEVAHAGKVASGLSVRLAVVDASRGEDFIQTVGTFLNRT
jgi:adenylate kinase